MKRIILSLTLMLFGVCSATAQTVPAKIKKFLDDYYTSPELGAWKKAPGYCEGKKWILTGDFNGDGRTDYLARIITGKTAKKRSLHLIGFINNKIEYTPDPFFEEAYSGELLRSSSTIIKKGTTVSLGLGEEGEGPSMDLKADAIAQYICETDASITYVYKDGEFKNIQQGHDSAKPGETVQQMPAADSQVNNALPRLDFRSVNGIRILRGRWATY